MIVTLSRFARTASDSKKQTSTVSWLFLRISVFFMTCFFCNAIGFTSSTYWLVYLAIIFNLLAIAFDSKSLTFDKGFYPYLLCIIVCCFNVLFSNNEEGFKYSLFLANVLLLSYSLRCFGNAWVTFFVNLLYFFVIIYTIATIIQFIDPDLIFSIDKKIMTSDDYAKISWFYYGNNAYAGLTNQTAMNAWYISIALGMSVFRFVYKKGPRPLNIILIIACLFALLLTKKRGSLLSVAAILLLFLFFRKDKTFKSLSVTAFVLMTSAVALFVLYSSVSQIRETLDNFFVGNNNDISSGRFAIWNTAFERFLSSPVFGVGWFGLRSAYLSGDAHNVYLQLLAETGLIGFACFMFFFINALLKTIKKTKYESRDDKKYIFSLSLFVSLLFLFKRMKSLLRFMKYGRLLSSIYNFVLFFISRYVPSISLSSLFILMDIIPLAELPRNAVCPAS